MAAKTSKKPAEKPTDVEIAPRQIETAVIPGTTPTPAPGSDVDDIDALLLGSGSGTKESTNKTSATPIVKINAVYVKNFLEGSKAEKDGKAKKERFADLLRTDANIQRVGLSRKRGEFLSCVKIVADAPIEVEKLKPDGTTEHGPDGKPVMIKVEVPGSISCSVSSDYSDIKPEAGVTVKEMIAKYKAILGDEDYAKYIGVSRTFVAKPELLSDKEKLGKAIACLQAAGLMDCFEIGYSFSPTVAFHHAATLSESAEKKMKLLIDAKLAKPKAASLSGK